MTFIASDTNVAYAEGRAKEAYALYKQAWALKQTYDIAGNLAQAEVELGKKADAAEHVAFTIAHFPPSVPSTQREKLEKLLTTLRAEVGTVRIRVVPAAAEVSLDGAVLDPLRLREAIYVEPGTHQFTASLSGFQDEAVTVTARAGGSEEVALQLHAVAPAGPAGTAAPPTPPPPSAQQAPEEGADPTLVITGAAIAGLSLGMGIVLTVLANGSAGDADSQYDALEQKGGAGACRGATFATDCDKLASTRDDATAYTNAAGWSFVVFGAVAAGTGVYLAVEGLPAKWKATPVVTSESAGMMIQGAF